MKIQKIIPIFLSATMLITTNIFASNTNIISTQSDNNNLSTELASQTSNEDARIKYIQALADNNNISFAEAELIDQKENEKILEERNINPNARDALEEIRYTTEREYFLLDKANDTELELSYEVKFLYSNVTNRGIRIESVQMPNMVIPGTSRTTINGSDYNISYTGSRDSVTVKRNCAFQYTINSEIAVSVGGPILDVSNAFGTIHYVTTRSDIYSSTVKASSLR